MADSFANVGTPVDPFASVGKPVDSFANVGKPVDSFDSVGKPVEPDKSLFQKAVGASKSVIDVASKGISEGMGLADTVAGYAVGAAGLATDIGLMAKGEFENLTRPEGQAPDTHVMKEARESSEAGLAANPALVHPLKSLQESMGLESKTGKKEDTLAEEFGQWTGEKIDRAAEFWKEKTGSETVGETLRLGANAAQYALDPVAKVGRAAWDKVGESVTKVKENAISLEKAKELEQLSRHQKQVEAEAAAKKKAEEEDKAWGQYKAQQEAASKEEKDNAFRRAESMSELKTRLQVEQMYKEKQVADDARRQEEVAKGQVSNEPERHPILENWGNPDEVHAAVQEAAQKGVKILHDQDGRIDTWNSHVDWHVLKGFSTVGELLNHIGEYLPTDFDRVGSYIYHAVKDVGLRVFKDKNDSMLGYQQSSIGSNSKGEWFQSDNSVHFNEGKPNARRAANGFEVLMHEITHAATMWRYAQGKGVIKAKNGGMRPVSQKGMPPTAPKAAADLDALLETIKDHPLVKDKDLSIETATGNILENTDELIANGLNNRPFQQILKQIPMPAGGTASSAFVKAMREALGIPETEHNALSRLIELVDQLGGDKNSINTPHMEGDVAVAATPTKEGHLAQAPPTVETEHARASKLEEGKADPELMIMLGAGAMGAATYTALTANGDTTLPGFIGKIIAGGGMGILMARAPSAYRDAKNISKAEFVDKMVERHGEAFKAAAGRLWEEKTPEAWKISKKAQSKADKYLIQKEVIDRGYRVDGAAKASMVAAMKARQELTKMGLTEEMAQAIYDLEDGKEVSQEVKDWHENTYKPIIKDLGEILSQIEGITKRDSKELMTDFFPRMALDKRTTLQKLMEGDNAHLGGKASSSYGRSIFAVDTKEFGPMVVHVGKDGTITGFHKGNEIPLGKGKATLGEQLVDGNGNPLGKLREAGKNEVEEHSDTRYWNDAVSVALIKRAEAQAYLDQMRFFQSIKDSPDLQHLFNKDMDKAPKGWKPLPAYAQRKLPLFRNYAFEPRLLETLEDLMGKEPGGAFTELMKGINNIAMKNLLLNPLPHVDNELVHYITAKGLTNFHKGATNMTMFDAWESVKNQDDVQMELMQAGLSTLYSDRWINNNIKSLAEKQMKELQQAKGLDDFAQRLGLSPLEFYAQLSQKTGDLMWHTRDMLVTHLAHLRMEQIGKEYPSMPREAVVKNAVQGVMKDMPSYRLPPRVAEEFFKSILGEDTGAAVSRGVSQVGSNQLATPFFRYHYAVTSELSNIAKEITTGTVQEKLHAMDKVGALAGWSIVLNYLMDPIAQMVSGDDQAKTRRAGPLHIIERAQAMANGEPDSELFMLMSIMSPPMWTPLVETAIGRSIPFGHKIATPGSDTDQAIGERATYGAQHMLPQAGMFGATNPSGDIDWQSIMAKQGDIQLPSARAKASKEKESEQEYKTGMTKEERLAERKRKKEERDSMK